MLIDNEFIPVFGDSNTVGRGLPVRERWHSKLNEELPIYNAGAIWKYAQTVGSAEKGALTHPGARSESHVYADI